MSRLQEKLPSRQKVAAKTTLMHFLMRRPKKLRCLDSVYTRALAWAFLTGTGTAISTICVDTGNYLA